jgi:hypothetical protein
MREFMGKINLKNKCIFSILSFLFLTSCASISNIVPAGPDTYLVSGSDLSIGASGAQIKTDLYKKASDYCATQDKVFKPVDTSSVDYRVFRGTANAELTFRCISK